MKNSDSSTDLSYLLDMEQDSSFGRDTRIDARYFLNLVLRFRWVLITPFCLAMIVGIYLAATLPRMYRSESTILVEPQSVPDKYVHATVPIEIDARIASLAQQVLSSSNLMVLIQRFKLFSDNASEDLVIEEKVENMRSRLRVRIADEELGKGKRAGSKASAFTISYEDSDPRKAYQVVNSMATFVIDQNLKMRESSAFGTSEFLQSELTKMRARLEEVEKALEEYRRVNMGELPEQLPSNLAMLERLQQQLSQSHQSLRDEKNRLLIVENQLKSAQQSSSPSTVTGLPSADSETKTLEGLKQQLMEYQTKYTANHPDVVTLKKKIEALKKELAKGGKTPMSSIRAIEAEIVKIQAQIEHYQKRVENTPKREQELLLLKRDYDNIKNTYSSVLNRKLEADIALNMEKTQKGEQFRILDPPRMPEKPISPNLTLILMACIASGLGIGGGIVFLCEFFDNSVRRPEALQARLSLTVLVAIPAMEHMQGHRGRVLGWLNNGLSAAGPDAASPAEAPPKKASPDADKIEPDMVSLVKPDSPEMELFRLLRTRILFPQNGRRPPRTILVTSALPEEGKSFVAANLAVNIAKNVDEHVLLVDCDLRKPSIHTKFGFSRVKGLSEYLSAGLELESLLLKAEVEKLTLLPSGDPPQNPSELITSSKMEALIEELKIRYDDRYIIFDSPPSLMAPETSAIAKWADGILVVVKYGTPMNLVEELVSHLDRHKIIGAVINKINQAEFRSYSYNKYYRSGGYYRA